MLLFRALWGLQTGSSLLDPGKGEILSLNSAIFTLQPWQLVMSRRRQLTISRGNSQLATENNFIIIPGDSLDVVIGVSNLFDVPIYW